MDHISEVTDDPDDGMPPVDLVQDWLSILLRVVKNKDGYVKPHKDFEPLVDRVTMEIRDRFKDPDMRADWLRALVKSDLWNLCLCESILHRKAHSNSAESQAAQQDIQHDGLDTDKRDGEANVSDGSDEDDGNETWSVEMEELEEDGSTPLDKLMAHLTLISYVEGQCMISAMANQTQKEDLRRQLDRYISEYLAGRTKDPDHIHQPVFSSDWLKHLHDHGILLEPKHELDWSGRGQHVAYEAWEEEGIPLQAKKVLGYSANALVESVQCRRILLARKTVKCNRRLKKEDVVMEVQHLQRLRHSHIVRVVGTYTINTRLCILLYPAADQNLEELMDFLVNLEPRDLRHGFHTLPRFVGCLSNAVSFIHRSNVKHMDIKPKNVLVQQHEDRYKVYIADFGIAKAYKSSAEAFTDSPTPFTRTYAAPEVVLQDIRGFSADIFSLGCVFMEIFATMRSTPQLDEREFLARIRGCDYQTNRGAVITWYHSFAHLIKYNQTGETINFDEELLELITRTLSRSPEERPTADDLRRATVHLRCNDCNTGSEPFVATST